MNACLVIQLIVLVLRCYRGMASIGCYGWLRSGPVSPALIAGPRICCSRASSMTAARNFLTFRTNQVLLWWNNVSTPLSPPAAAPWWWRLCFLAAAAGRCTMMNARADWGWSHFGAVVPPAELAAETANVAEWVASGILVSALSAVLCCNTAVRIILQIDFNYKYPRLTLCCSFSSLF